MTTVTKTARKTTIVPPPFLPFSEKQSTPIRLYPVSNFTFETKSEQLEEDNSVNERLERLRNQYGNYGMRRSCEAILLCHEHGHPYVLMLQIANTFFKLPGGYLWPPDQMESEIRGFTEILNKVLSPEQNHPGSDDPINYQWDIGDCVAQWWRPNFEHFMYPFIPPHITRPKETKKFYLVKLPKKKVIAVPKNMKMLAIPLFELYENNRRYGGQLASIPIYLSRYNFEFVDENDNVIGHYPGAAAGKEE